jgi:DUF1680 family protein
MILTTAAFTLALLAPAALQAELFPLSSVRLLKSPFTAAADANLKYLLALEPDRLLAPFRREAGLTPRKPSYENWENIGLDGHTAGHYVAALADMIAAGHDTKDGELRRRLNYMVDELAACQDASPDGYVGGIPGSREFWKTVATGHIEAFNGKWVPWYNLHKTYAGLRDAYLVAGNQKARAVLVKMGDWAASVTANLSDEQMQRMLGYEQGGMNEVLADIYAITGDKKYLTLAERFNHQAILAPLERQEDRLTGLHANTQIPKVIGFERIAALSGDKAEDTAARFFWEDVTSKRSVAFGGNSVSEHFNNPKDFQGLLQHREGPETCNTYNMLRLTEGLFASVPKAAYADYYERALYNHILASINPTHPGYVYFTPIRPGHYRVYSEPGQGFWCCVGTGMENPGRYGQFIYAKAKDGIYVNLFIPSVLSVPERGMTVRQDTAFPDEERTSLTLRLKRPTAQILYLRQPGWVAAGAFSVKVNGKLVPVKSTPSSYATIRRIWKDGDKIEIQLPMRTTVEGLPDGSSWYSILHGPIVLATPTGTQDQVGLHAGAGRGDHIAHGPLIPLDKMPVLLTSPSELAKHVIRDPAAGPMRFRLKDVASPSSKDGIALEPFFRLQESRYQMIWELTSKEGLAARQARLAEEERAKIARDAATLDAIAVGEQQPEVDHAMTGEGLESGIFDGRRWRHGRVIQYVLNAHDAKEVDLAVTYSGSDNNRTFEISANGVVLATQRLKGDKPGEFFEVRYALPEAVLKDGRVTVKFVGQGSLAGGLYDVRLLRR